MNILIYILPLFSVLFGFFVGIFFRPKSKKGIKLLLAFSGAFLLSLTVMHLLPEVYNSIENGASHDHSHHHGAGIFIMIGIVFQIVLEYFSKGAEHGHVHTHSHLNHIPWALFFSLCLHALLEGFPINAHNHLAYGIAVHHFPIAVILTLFFANSKLSKSALFFCMMFFSLMTPLGTFLADKLIFLSNYKTEISGLVVGILFHISSTIIFESNEGHKFNSAKLLVIILGVTLAYFM